MDQVSALRLQMPVPAAQLQPTEARITSALAADSARPLADTQRRDAVQQPSGMMAQAAVELGERDRDHHPAADARAAALAARDAYIKASIAAGMSPLPLP